MGKSESRQLIALYKKRVKESDFGDIAEVLKDKTYQNTMQTIRTLDWMKGVYATVEGKETTLLEAFKEYSRLQKKMFKILKGVENTRVLGSNSNAYRHPDSKIREFLSQGRTTCTKGALDDEFNELLEDQEEEITYFPWQIQRDFDNYVEKMLMDTEDTERVKEIYNDYLQKWETMAETRKQATEEAIIILETYEV